MCYTANTDYNSLSREAATSYVGCLLVEEFESGSRVGIIMSDNLLIKDIDNAKDWPVVTTDAGMII